MKANGGWLKNRKKVFALAMAICISILLTQSAAGYVLLFTRVESEVKRWDNKTLQFAVEAVESATNEIAMLARQIADNEELNDNIRLYLSTTQEYERYELNEEINQQLRALMSRVAGVRNVYVYASGKRPIGTAALKLPLPAQIGEDAFQTRSGVYMIMPARANEGLLFASQLNSAAEGVLLYIQMNADWLNKLLSPGRQIFVHTLADGTMLHGKDAHGLWQGESVADETLGLMFSIAEDGGRSQRERERGLLLFGGSLLLCAALSAGLAFLLSGYLMRPLWLLQAGISEEIQIGRLFAANRALNVKMRRYLLIVCVVPFCLNACADLWIIQSVLGSISTYAAECFTAQTAMTFEQYQAELQQASVTLVLNEQLNHALAQGENRPLEASARHTINEQLLLLGRDMRVSLYDRNGLLVSTTMQHEEPVDARVVRQLHAENLPFPQWYVRGDRLVVCRSIRDWSGEYGKQYMTLGYLALDMPVDLFLTGERFLEESDSVFLLSQDCEPLWTWGAALPEQMIWPEKAVWTHRGMLYTRYLLPLNNWSLNFSIRQDTLIQSRNDVLSGDVIALLCCLLTVLSVSFMASSYYAKETERLQYNLVALRMGIEQDAAEGIEDDELKQVAKVFNQMIRQVYQEKLTRLEKEKQLNRAELRALQAQINPHFLYNTLESINCVIMEGKKQTAIQMIWHLSRIFRAVSDIQELFIYLLDEVEYAREFEALQTFRYQDRLSVTWNIERAAYRCRVPKLLLQPVLENAIEHGMRPDGSMLHIHVGAYVREGQLYIEFENDGRPLGRAGAQAGAQTVWRRGRRRQNRTGERASPPATVLGYGIRRPDCEHGLRRRTRCAANALPY
ncbi:MAG TPA: histidine kinase [Clostridia bacterium]|nr:histidine kinase [Clostridia bacterium]